MAHNHSLEPHFYSFGKTVRQAGQWDQNTVAPPVLKVPKVFISYSQDSPEHVDRVLEISNNLRARGIDCTIDQYEISPPEGWPRWCENQIEQADFVLVVCTEKYYSRFRGKDKKGVGLGAKWEGAVITQDLYDAEASNTKFIPVVFTTRDTKYIPKVLRSPSRYDVSIEAEYISLYRHLTNQPSTLKPELGNLRPMPPLARRPGFSTSETERKDEADLQSPVSDEEQVASQTKPVTRIQPPVRDVGDIRLRNRRPGGGLPTDFRPILFVNPHEDMPSPVVDLIRTWGAASAAVMHCCIVAHYQMDVELSLLEIEEAFAVGVEAEKDSTVWIRGDELWCSPVVRRPDELFREDWAVLRQLRPRNIEMDLFADEFDRLLDRPNLLFMLDFSRLTSNNLQRLDDPNQESRRAAIIDGVGAFLRNISIRGHRAVIGLPRHLLGLVD